MYRASLEVANDIYTTERELQSAKQEIERLRFEAANYKAYFFHRTNLVEKLDKQQRSNFNATHQGFCITSDEYLTLEDMFYDGILTDEEYKFCMI